MKASSSNQNYYVGIGWFLLSLVFSISLDVVQKYLGQNIPCVQITFMRFLFGTISLLPFMLYYGKSSFYTSRPSVHIFRGAMLFGGIALWCYGLKVVPLSMVTTVSFTIPLFTLPLAVVFLKEKVGVVRWTATLIGFIGILLVFNPTASEFNPSSLWLVAAALMFAGLDVINKRFIVKESMLAMLFYTALITMFLGVVPAFMVWVMPTFSQLCLLFLLGCGANLILFCLLKAFQRVEASAVAPFRYVEFILSSLCGFLLFHEAPTTATYWGLLIIIPSALYVIYAETHQRKTSIKVSSNEKANEETAAGKMLSSAEKSQSE